MFNPKQTSKIIKTSKKEKARQIYPTSPGPTNLHFSVPPPALPATSCSAPVASVRSGPGRRQPAATAWLDPASTSAARDADAAPIAATSAVGRNKGEPKQRNGTVTDGTK